MGIDEELSIGELARRAGLRTSALRYYEERGLLRPSRRVAGRRRYGRGALERLRVIAAAQRSGFTLAEIKLLLSAVDRGATSKRWKAMATDKLAAIDAEVAQLERMRALLREGLRCECLDLATCALIGDGAPPPGA